jgi:hypothetical protein
LVAQSRASPFITRTKRPLNAPLSIKALAYGVDIRSHNQQTALWSLLRILSMLRNHAYDSNACNVFIGDNLTLHNVWLH